jgi:hypothetical protein
VEIKTPITFMSVGIPEKNTQCGARRELVVGGGGQVGIAGASKHAEMIIGGRGAVEREVRGAAGQCFSGVTVKKICGGVEGVSPINRR